ncbi:MAG: hypothetical protein KDD50_08835 [Bdellovibrionales bacterium]|nr:hypothetical protein [Bdellovibrionales bacterium]
MKKTARLLVGFLIGFTLSVPAYASLSCVDVVSSEYLKSLALTHKVSSVEMPVSTAPFRARQEAPKDSVSAAPSSGIPQLTLEMATEKIVKTAQYYIDHVRRIQARLNDVLPEFTLSHIDQAKTRLWEGVPLNKTPEVMKQALPNFVHLIGHQLLEAAPGKVKSDDSAKNFVHARLRMPWDKKEFSDTNIGFNRRALYDNLFREKKWLCREGAKAVVIDLHGGGTKTTGHHVAITKMDAFNKYDVDVISIDLPNHGEGARSRFTSLELFEYLEALRQTYIPSDVPVFISGHSLGGVYVNLFMVHSDRPGSTFKQSFAGLMSLSPVSDAQPGTDAAAKFRNAQLIEMDEQIKAKMAEDDQILHEGLTKAAKLGLLNMSYANQTIAELDWTIPKHRGAEYLPTLMTIGKYDFLYVGKEDLYKNYFDALTNVTTRIYGRRRVFGPGIAPHVLNRDNMALLDVERVEKVKLDKKTQKPQLDEKGNPKVDVTESTIFNRANISDPGLESILKRLTDYGHKILDVYDGSKNMSEARPHIESFMETYKVLTGKNEAGYYNFPLAVGRVRTVEQNKAMKKSYTPRQMDAQADIVEAIQEYIGEVKNLVKLLLEENREEVEDSSRPYVDIQEWSGEVAKIGHLTMDHLPVGAKNNQPEQYRDMIEFMASVTGKDLPVVESKVVEKGQANEKDKLSVFLEILQTYTNNLAFREFIRDSVVVVKKPSDFFVAKMQAKGGISKALKKLRSGEELSENEIVVKDKSGNTLLELRHKDGPKKGQAYNQEELMAFDQEISDRQKLAYLPPKGSAHHDIAENNLKRREEIIPEIKQLKEKKKVLSQASEGLFSKVEKMKAELQYLFDRKVVKPEEILEVEAEMEKLFETLKQHDNDQESLHNAFFADLIDKGMYLTPEGRFNEEVINELTPELRDYYKRYTADFKRYAELVKRRDQLLVYHAMEGFYGPQATQIAIELYGVISSQKDWSSLGSSGLIGQAEAAMMKIHELSGKIINLQHESDTLTVKYIQLVAKEDWNVEIYSVYDMFNSPFEVSQAFLKQWQDVWGDWKELWKDKEDSNGVSLY